MLADRGIESATYTGPTPLVPDTGKMVFSVTKNLVRKSGYYIVLANDVFNYFKIGDILPHNDYFYKISSKKPPVLREGFVVVEGELHYVTIKDLMNGIVRKSRKLELKRGTLTYDDFINGTIYPAPAKTSISKSKPDAGSAGGSETQPAGNPPLSGSTGGGGEEKTSAEGGRVSNISVKDILSSTKNRKHKPVSEDAELAELEGADLAFEEQIRSLYDSISEKEGTGGEEWEIEEAS